MGHSHGTTLGDLFLEQRDHAAVAPQYITEPDRHIIGPGVAVHGLDQHLTEPFGSTHDIRGVYRLIRGDKYEFIHSVPVCCLCYLIGTEYIIFNSLVWAVLHERHMFMCSCMIHDIRSICLENAVDTLFVTHGCDQYHQIQLRILADQLLLDVVGIIFINIQDDQLLRMMGCQLSAQFTSDGTAASGHQYHLAADMSQHFFRIDTDRLSAQQILDLHFFQTGYGDIPIDQLISSRNGPQFTAGLLADIQNFFSRLHTGRRNCEDDLINTISSHSIQNTLSAANDRHATHKFAVASGLVIDNALGPHA